MGKSSVLGSQLVIISLDFCWLVYVESLVIWFSKAVFHFHCSSLRKMILFSFNSYVCVSV